MSYSLGLESSFVHPPPSTSATSGGGELYPGQGAYAAGGAQLWTSIKGITDFFGGLFGGGQKPRRGCVNLCTGEYKVVRQPCYELQAGWIRRNHLDPLLAGDQTYLNDFKTALGQCGGSYSKVEGLVEQIASKYGISLSGLSRNTSGDYGGGGVVDPSRYHGDRIIDYGVDTEQLLVYSGMGLGLVVLLMLVLRR